MNHSSNWGASDVGGLCWVSDPAEAYIEATVEAIDGKMVTCASSDGRHFELDVQAPLQPPAKRGRKQEPPRRILQRVPITEARGVDNMDELSTLHEASILHNIEIRFRYDLIYSNSGPILIAMNPFKWLPIYGEEVIKRYHGREYGSMPPHCFQEAEAAFQNLRANRKNQARARA